MLFDGKYALSNLGRWYSFYSKKIMRQKRNSSGYKRVSLSLNGRTKWILTHIKVVEVYGDSKGKRIPVGLVSLRCNGLSIDHLDENKDHNQSNNLEIVTHKENCLRRSKTRRKK